MAAQFLAGIELSEIALNLTKAIESAKVETPDLMEQFDAVSGNKDEIDAASAAQTLEDKKAQQMADEARRSPGSIGFSQAGGTVSGFNSGINFGPSRITSKAFRQRR